MSLSRDRLPGAILLGGAAILAAWGIALLPRQLPTPPATPFDRSDPALAASFRFLSAARGLLPAGATATVIAEPRDAGQETSLYGAAVALLDGRTVLPAAQWGAFTPQHESQAEYVLVRGPLPSAPPGELVAAVEGGAVYRRKRPGA
jgi:hypothetical protein